MYVTIFKDMYRLDVSYGKRIHRPGVCESFEFKCLNDIKMAAGVNERRQPSLASQMGYSV